MSLNYALDRYIIKILTMNRCNPLGEYLRPISPTITISFKKRNMKILVFLIVFIYAQAEMSAGRILTKIKQEDKTTCKKVGNGRNARFQCPNPTLKVWHGEPDIGRYQTESL